MRINPDEFDNDDFLQPIKSESATPTASPPPIPQPGMPSAFYSGSTVPGPGTTPLTAPPMRMPRPAKKNLGLLLHWPASRRNKSTNLLMGLPSIPIPNTGFDWATLAKSLLPRILAGAVAL
ncbi:MAG TPA: hypothetical protein VNG90_01255, partial [Candidatus Acidoferrum sp.]|nr:hypothetical protein [Candidatus Acidoferrum sp.]